MELENAIIQEFKRLKKPGDVRKISELADVSRQSVYNVYHSGKYSMKLFETMVQFYRDRKSMYEQALNDFKTMPDGTAD